MSDEYTENQYLTFLLHEEYYALTVSRVREVLELSELTKIPGMPPYMKGVLNVRGTVLPVVDLRLKFGIEEAEHTIDTAIIVAEVTGQDENTVIVGCLVDSVDQVIRIEESEIEPAPGLGTTVDVNFIAGMGKQDERFIIILDIDRVFATEELHSVEASASAPAAAQAKQEAKAAAESEEELST
jgi:purine-binding chemotaxis protein CheW